MYCVNTDTSVAIGAKMALDSCQHDDWVKQEFNLKFSQVPQQKTYIHKNYRRYLDRFRVNKFFGPNVSKKHIFSQITRPRIVMDKINLTRFRNECYRACWDRVESLFFNSMLTWNKAKWYLLVSMVVSVSKVSIAIRSTG